MVPADVRLVNPLLRWLLGTAAVLFVQLIWAVAAAGHRTGGCFVGHMAPCALC